MTELRAQMAADLAVIHADPTGPGEAATYVPATGSTIATRVTIVRTGRKEQEFSDGVWIIETAQAYILVADVPVTTLQDTLVLASVNGGTTDTWYVRQVYAENGAFRELELLRQVQKRLSGEGDEQNRSRGAAARR